MELKPLNRDPKLNDFSKDDLVLNTSTGDIFAKTDNKLFKIASRNTLTDTSTDTVLSLIPPSSTKDTILTDLLEYKEITITNSNQDNFLFPVIYGGNTYYNLDLSKVKAMFIRLDDDFSYPIGTITPPTINGRAHTIFIESGHNTGHYLSKPPVNALLKTEITVDTGDLVKESFITQEVNGTSYNDTLKIDSGCRVMLVRSRFDWKIQSLSDFTGITPNLGNINGGSF